jgi:NADH dehydrogenase FAD-containing subunit
VTQVCADGLVLDGGARIPFDLCAWAGGFVVPPLARDAGLAVNDSGRAVVDETLRSVSHPNIYVVGDAAAVPGRWGDQLAMGCRTGGLMGPRVADSIAARLTGRAPKPFRYRYVHECLSLGRRRGVVQFLHADETPADRVLTGRLAIRYKNLTLDGARWLFRHPGPYTGGRRHVKAGDAETAAKLASA